MPSYISTIIICVILVVIAFFAIRSYIKKISSGCCGAGGDSIKKIKPADTEKSNYPYEKIIEIEGMTCKNCAARIENAFNSLDGFYANVNLKKNEATVLMKEQKDDVFLRQIVRNIGYKPISVREAK